MILWKVFFRALSPRQILDQYALLAMGYHLLYFHGMVEHPTYSLSILLFLAYGIYYAIYRKVFMTDVLLYILGPFLLPVSTDLFWIWVFAPFMLLSFFRHFVVTWTFVD